MVSNFLGLQRIMHSFVFLLTWGVVIMGTDSATAPSSQLLQLEANMLSPTVDGGTPPIHTSTSPVAVYGIKYLATRPEA